MTERFHIRIANPFGERPVKVEILEPSDAYAVESLDAHFVVLKNEFDVLELIEKVNKARIQAEEEAARQSRHASTILNLAFSVISSLAWKAGVDEWAGKYHQKLLDSVRDVERKGDAK